MVWVNCRCVSRLCVSLITMCFQHSFQQSYNRHPHYCVVHPMCFSVMFFMKIFCIFCFWPHRWRETKMLVIVCLITFQWTRLCQKYSLWCNVFRLLCFLLLYCIWLYSRDRNRNSNFQLKWVSLHQLLSRIRWHATVKAEVKVSRST